MASSDHWQAYAPWQDFFIIDMQWDPFMLTERNIITVSNLSNIRHMLQSHNYLVVKWIIYLLRVIVAPLNIINNLGILTLIFFSLYGIFCICIPLQLPNMYYLIAPLSWNSSVVSFSLYLFYLFFVFTFIKRKTSISKELYILSIIYIYYFPLVLDFICYHIVFW